jgi:hypothetical protein
MAKITPEQVTQAQAHVVGLLNQVESTLTGWVLGYDREAVAKHIDGLYKMCDTDTPPAVKKEQENA